jgi:hypothetical protein
MSTFANVYLAFYYFTQFNLPHTSLWLQFVLILYFFNPIFFSRQPPHPCIHCFIEYVLLRVAYKCFCISLEELFFSILRATGFV